MTLEKIRLDFEWSQLGTWSEFTTELWSLSISNLRIDRPTCLVWKLSPLFNEMEHLGKLKHILKNRFGTSFFLMKTMDSNVHLSGVDIDCLINFQPNSFSVSAQIPLKQRSLKYASIYLFIILFS